MIQLKCSISLINVNKFCMDLFCHANTSAIVRDIMIYSIGSEKLIYINQRIGVEMEMVKSNS
jgi:hypothetical protein